MKRCPPSDRLSDCSENFWPVLISVFGKQFARRSCIFNKRTQMGTLTDVLSIFRALLCTRLLSFFLCASDGECFCGSPQRELMIKNFGERRVIYGHITNVLMTVCPVTCCCVLSTRYQ